MSEAGVRSAFIASTSVWKMVSARDGESFSRTGVEIGRKTMASDIEKSVGRWLIDDALEKRDLASTSREWSTNLGGWLGKRPGRVIPGPRSILSQGLIKAV